MNLNEDVMATNRAHRRGRPNRNALNLNRRNFQVKTQLNKLIAKAPKKPPNRSSTTSSSTYMNWGGPNKNSSTTLTTGSSSRTTTTASETNNEIILALTEGRGNATCEIGMAVLNITRSSIILCQFSDTQSYINTLTKINILNPTEVVVPITFIESRSMNRLVQKVQQQFSSLRITGFSRGAFNKGNGMERIKRLCLPQYDSVLLSLQHKYYCVAAASAVLSYVESNRNVYYAKESVKVVYQESEGSMIIDISAADKLELVASERIVHPGKKSSLLGVLNFCLTRIGTRTLRSNILQPPCSVPDIEARLDCVTELIRKPEILGAIQSILVKFSNIDQLLSLGSLLADSLDSYTERQLNYIMLLNIIVDQITPLKEVFHDTQQPFFLEMRETLANPKWASLKETITKTVQSDAYPTKGSNALMQRCFAIKPGVNSLLDAVRKIYSERLDEMREYVSELSRKYGMNLFLSNNNKKGFHIIVMLTQQQKKNLKKSDLPKEFIQVCRLAKCYTVKTEELVTFSVRIEDITSNILHISNRVIRALLMEIRGALDLFYKLVEDIAKLDMLQSLAEASSGYGYVRPKFANYMDISNAKHPLLDKLCPKEPVANPIQASSEYNMHIITGPNGSGKSIYIRQVALIQIMAQIGCFVPASSATFRVCDRLFTRISLEDNMDCNLSSFELEMLEIKHFLTTMTNHSLVIIDELCRSTALEEGTALAMAICEKILTTSAYIFFTTHYALITKLQDLYCNVKVWQKEAHISGTCLQDTKLNFKYSLIPGCTSLKRYSIYLLAKIWPENIVKYIEDTLDKMTQVQVPRVLKVVEIDCKQRLLYEIKSEFQTLKRKKELTKAAINTLLNKYQEQLQINGIKVVQEETTESSDTALFSKNEYNTKPDSSNLFGDSFSNYCLAKNVAANTASVTQLSFNYIPGQEEDENLEDVDYLIPEVSLRVTEEPLAQNLPNLNLSYLNTQSSYHSCSKFIPDAQENSNHSKAGVLSNQFSRQMSTPEMFRTEFTNHSGHNTYHSCNELLPDIQANNNHPNGDTNTNQFIPHISTTGLYTPDFAKLSRHNSNVSHSEKVFNASGFEAAPFFSKTENVFEEQVRSEVEAFSTPRCMNSAAWKHSLRDIYPVDYIQLTPMRTQDESLYFTTSAQKLNVSDRCNLPPEINPELLQNTRPSTKNLSQRSEKSNSSSRIIRQKQDSTSSTDQSKFNYNLLQQDLRTSTPIPFIGVTKTPNELRSNVPRDESMTIQRQSQTRSPINQPKLTQDTLRTNLRSPTPLCYVKKDRDSQITEQRFPSTEHLQVSEEFFTVNKSNLGNRSNCETTSQTDDYSISYSPLCPSPERATQNQKSSKINIISNVTVVPANLATPESKQTSTSTSVSSRSNGNTNKNAPVKRRQLKVAKFIPPKKLTKREIEEEFAEQNRRMMENINSSNVSEYAQQICNRPSVKQLQQTEHIALIRKTEEGMVVIPVEPQKPKKPRKTLHFNNPYKGIFEANLFSDKNEEKFTKFLQDRKKNTKEASLAGSCSLTAANICDYGGNEIATVGRTQIIPQPTRQNQSTTQKSFEGLFQDISQESVSKYLSFTPEGYYKEHKTQIESIVNKYMNSQSKAEYDKRDCGETSCDLFQL